MQCVKYNKEMTKGWGMQGSGEWFAEGRQEGQCVQTGRGPVSQRCQQNYHHWGLKQHKFILSQCGSLTSKIEKSVGVAPS